MDEWYGKSCTPITLNKYIYGNSDAVNGIDPSGNITLLETQIVQHEQGRLRTAKFQSNVLTFSGKSAGKSRSLTKKVGCFIGQGFISANKFNSSQGHHPIQQSLGGAYDQQLLHVLRNAHNMFHTIQNLLFREAGFPPLNVSEKIWESNYGTSDIKKFKKARKLMLKTARIVDKFCGYKAPINFTTYINSEFVKAGY